MKPLLLAALTTGAYRRRPVTLGAFRDNFEQIVGNQK
jgi:hypothetical protein